MVVVDVVDHVEHSVSAVDVVIVEMAVHVEDFIDVNVANYVVGANIDHFVIPQVSVDDYDAVGDVHVKMVNIVLVALIVSIVSSMEAVADAVIINNVGSIAVVVEVIIEQEIIYVDQVMHVIINNSENYLTVLTLLGKVKDIEA